MADPISPSPLYSLSPPLTIITPRLLLRPIYQQDAKSMFKLRSNPRMLVYTSIECETDVSQASAWIAKCMANPLGFNFSVFLRKEGDEASATKAAAEAVAKGLDPAEGLTCIGVCGGIRTPEFGYMIDESYWGKGYATESVGAVVETYFETFPNGMPGLGMATRKGAEFERYYASAYIVKENTASAAVLKKLGFKFESESVEKDEEPPVTLQFWRRWRPGFQVPEKSDSA